MTEISTLAEGVLDAKRELILARAQKAKIEALRAEKELAEYSAQVEYARSSNFRNRVYDFVSEIDKGSVEEALDTINRWARMSKDPVTIRFTSPGGDIIHGFSLFDTIRMHISDGIPITTIVTGQGASMAAVLLQSGSHRAISQNAEFYLHEVQGGSRGSASDLEENATNARRLNERLTKVLAERSVLKHTEIASKIKRKGWTLDAEGTLKYGFADSILKTSYLIGKGRS